MIREIQRIIDRKLGGIRQAFRGVVTLVKAAGAVQLIQGEGVAGEGGQDDEYFQHYGYTSNPPPNSMRIVLPIGGKTSHGIVIATEHGSYRLKNLVSGEMAIYDDQGQKVHLTRSGIVVDGAGLPVTVRNTPHVDFQTPDVNMSGNLNVTGKITGTGGIAISGSSGTTATISGNLDTTGTIKNNGHDVGSTHQHANSGGVGVGGMPI